MSIKMLLLILIYSKNKQQNNFFVSLNNQQTIETLSSKKLTEDVSNSFNDQ